MPESVDYDAALIQIDPETLGADGKRLYDLAREMVESVVRINDTAAALKLGWVAPSADEAHEFGERWTRVMQQMFGEEGSPGVLPAIAGGVLAAAVGFSRGELALEAAWQNFSNELSAPSGAPSGPADRMGPEFPITQDFPHV
ncbi:hypothetical protein [Streptomyces zhihengii]|uniref:hypothetical protein n=1 Tax=Streptomyces zhihengii TaxID=1818004 RepID=UPI0033B7CCB1